MEFCWARCVGPCGGGPSREHVMSKSQFHSESIHVKGFSWCPDGKTIGINSLVAKNLCRHHNQQLSPADAEAKKLLDTFVAINQRTEAWKAGKRLPRIVREIDAARIEQWLMKTTFNMALQGTTHEGLFKDGEPNQHLVRIAFGLEEFTEPYGLFWVVRLGEKIAGKEMGSLEWESFVRPEDHSVVAARLDFHGHRMWLSLPGAPQRENLSRGTEIGFLETSCEIRLRWSKKRLRERRRLTGSS
jgi:hypothetical protein